MALWRELTSDPFELLQYRAASRLRELGGGLLKLVALLGFG
ncbi:MAG: hypothetical protein VYD05_00220 [Planctomycetota bacterium]|nr:hypothetical protein [Planctomycetota bacterium]